MWVCGVCSLNRQTLSIWSRYFKEKYVRNHTDTDVHSFGQPTNNQGNACLFACVVNAEQATFWHSFAFVSVSHALFAFVYRCGCALKVTIDGLMRKLCNSKFGQNWDPWCVGDIPHHLKRPKSVIISFKNENSLFLKPRNSSKDDGESLLQPTHQKPQL